MDSLRQLPSRASPGSGNLPRHAHLYIHHSHVAHLGSKARQPTGDKRPTAPQAMEGALGAAYLLSRPPERFGAPGGLPPA